MIHAGRGTSFFFDEWDWIQGRRDWSLDTLLAPHNGHASIVPVLVFKLLFEIVGLETYLPYRLAVLACHLGVVVLLFIYARRRVGDVLALGAAVSLLFFGPAWMDLLWGLQVGYLVSIVGGLGALLALDRRDRVSDALAAGLLMVSLASSSLGLAFLGALTVEVVGRSDRLRRWPVVVVPALLYAVWYVAYRTASEATVDNAFATPGYMADAAAAAVAALFGLGSAWGPALTVAVVVALGFAVGRFATASWRLAALVAAPLLFWGLTGVGRAHLHEPGASRYLYPGALMVLLLALEAARGVRVGREWWLAIAAAGLAFVTVSNVGELRDGGRFLRGVSTEVRGALAATEIAGTRLPVGFRPAPQSAPQITAGPYLAAVADLGSPASIGSVERSRRAADDALVRGYELELAPVATAGACRPAGSAVEVPVPPGGLAFENVMSVRVRRWADEFSEPILAPRGVAGLLALRIPVDGDLTHWQVELTGGPTMSVCLLPG